MVMKALMTVAAVGLGAVAAPVVAKAILKREEVGGVPVEALLGAALIAGGLQLGMPTLIAAGAGALAAPIRARLEPLALEAFGQKETAVAGWPAYMVGEMPSGGALYALPPGATGEIAQANLAAIAGLS
jgi:hypothetical protein